jgi:hypothetical protein
MSTIKNYILFIVFFIFSLLIPTLLYTFHYKPISILQENDRKPFAYPPMVKYSYRWPSINPSMPINKEDSLFKQIDRKYCGSDRCRFILPVVITEQGK